MSIPLVLQNPDQMPGPLRDELEQLVASIQTQFNVSDSWGRLTNVTFSADYYSGITGTWTMTGGMQRFFRYTTLGAIMVLQLKVIGSTTAGSNTALRVKLPGEHRLLTTDDFLGSAQISWTGNSVLGQVIADPADTRFIRVIRDTLGTAFPNVTGDLTIGLSVMAAIVHDQDSDV